MGETQFLPAADSAWLRMDEPSNLMMIVGVMVFERQLDVQRLEQVLQDRMLIHRRFRQRVVDSAGRYARPRWEDVSNVDVRRHLTLAPLPSPADRGCLQQRVSELMGTPLDRSKPLWHFDYIDNFAGGAALVGRIHHCIGDGMSLMQVLLSMTDPVSPGEDEPPPRQASSRRGNLVRRTVGALSVVGRLLFMRRDPHTVFRGVLGRRKRVVWSSSFQLDRIKAIGQELGATVNDVLIAAVTAGLRDYLVRHGPMPREEMRFRAVIPVNLRPPGQTGSLGNRFGLVFLALPVGRSGPLERLRAVKRGMDRIKRSPEAPVAFALLQMLGASSAEIQCRVVRYLGRKATAVMTNVPGPSTRRQFCGVPVQDFMYWVPQSGRVGLGVSILSYVGNVRVGVATDAGLVPDPQEIIRGFEQALKELENPSPERRCGELESAT